MSIGRGRGWRVRDDEETTLPRPGQFKDQSSLESKLSQVERKIESMAIKDLLEKPFILTVMELFQQNGEKKFQFNEIVETLYNKAVNDREFGIKLAAIFGNRELWVLTDQSGNTTRSYVLRIMQNRYENRSELKKESKTKFRNTVSFFGEVYYQMTLASTVPLNLLVQPLIDYLEMVLQLAEHEDIELVATQIALNGRKMYEVLQTHLERLLFKVRSLLLHTELGLSSKGLLLFIIDFANQRYTPFSGELQEFYTSLLGTKTLVLMQRNTKTLTIITEKIPPENHVRSKDAQDMDRIPPNDSANKLGILIETTKTQHGFTKTMSIQERIQAAKSSSDQASEPNLPRAIRGSGRDQMFKENKKKGWEHDDRFEKDYA